MKITMYELLGMIKYGRVPKKIKYNGNIYNYEEDCDYFSSDYGYLFDRHNALSILNDELEILEEEKKTPEKLKLDLFTKNDVSYYVCNKINEIIDYLKSKGE